LRLGRIQSEALAAIAAGELPLNQLLELVCGLVQEELESGTVSLMLLEEDGLLYVAGGPCVPPALREVLDGLKPGPGAGNCGDAVYTGLPAYVSDTRDDPRWENMQEVVDTFQIRACWSHPIRVKGEVLGSFAVAHDRVALPSEDDKAKLEVFASLVAVAMRADEVRIESQRHEIALQRALRLESLGLLAGELAHDFNNLLVGVIGGLELAADPSFADVAAEHLEGARVAAHQAAALCQRFRSLAGEETEWQDSNLESLIEESLLVTRGVAQGIDVRWQPLPQGAPSVCLARTQVRQLLLNLIVNGAEAMGGKGVLRLSTEKGWRGVRYVRSCQIGAHLPAGHYLTFAVEDEGAGFSPEVLTSAFEPFFSTKPRQEQARGLGLATVAKIAKAHNATVRIASSPEGTRIEVSFPTPDETGLDEAQILVMGVPPEEQPDFAQLLAPSTTRFMDCGEAGAKCWSKEGPFDLLILDLRCGWASYDGLRVHDRHCRAVLIGDEEHQLERAQEYADPTPIGIARSTALESLQGACQQALAQRPRALTKG
jgi:signal transduction histidine kinase